MSEEEHYGSPRFGGDLSRNEVEIARTKFMALPDPTFEQSGLISIVVGSGAAWFGLYAGTHKKDAKE